MTQASSMPPRILVRAALVSAALVSVAALLLRANGRVWWCACGEGSLFAGDIWSRHNSQHLFDPYSFTHVLHGFLFAALLRPLFRFWSVSVANRAVVAIAIEAVWELVENSEAVIQKYRETTISLDYYGDSVLNSVADVLACAMGFVLASRLSVRVSAALFVATELALALWIHDGLLLNILMLVHPVEAVRQWQLGAAG